MDFLRNLFRKNVLTPSTEDKTLASQPDEGLERLLQDLKSLDVQDKKSAIVKIVDLQRKDERVIDALWQLRTGDSDAIVRKMAANALHALGVVLNEDASSQDSVPRQMSPPPSASSIPYGAQVIESRKKFDVRCTLSILWPNPEDFMFPFAATLETLYSGIKISPTFRGQGMDIAVQIGMYHKLTSDNTNEPIMIPYQSMSDIVSYFQNRKEAIRHPCHDNVPSDGDLIIWITFFNYEKVTRLALGLHAKNSADEIDQKETVALFNQILSNKRFHYIIG